MKLKIIPNEAIDNPPEVVLPSARTSRNPRRVCSKLSKELAVYDFDRDLKYAGIFALKGFVDSTSLMPIAVQFFRLQNLEGN